MHAVKKIIFILAAVICLTPIAPVDAAGLVPCGSGSDQGDACTICDFAEGINNIVVMIGKFAGIVAVLVFVVAGIFYIVSAGNPGMMGTAKTAIKNTFIGVIVILAAFVIISFALRAIAAKSSSGPLLRGSGAWVFTCSDAAVF